MPPHSCIIRFVDGDGEAQTFVARRSHGHPEEIVTNLSYHEVVFDQQEEQPPPGNVAAQFIFLDTLWYALREVPVEDLQDELLGFLYSPAQADIGNTGSFLRQHKILDSTNEVEPISYLYTVEIQNEGLWQIKVGENARSFDGPVSEVFDLISWGFSGELTEATRRF